MLQQNLSVLVSIIIPTYNRSQFIAETIYSIQNQTYQNWELIIVDDGSEDDTEQVIKSIDDCRISYYKLSHSGMEYARNNGLLKAKGEFIGFMDSDDLWAPTKLEKQIAFLKEHPAISFCLTGGYEFEKADEPLVFFYKQSSGIKTGDLFPLFFKSEVAALPQALMFRKECLDTAKFPEEIELGHIHFMLSLALHFKGAILYEPLFFRRLHRSNYSTINQTKRHIDGIELIKRYKKNLSPKVFKNALLKSYINFGENYLKNKQEIKALREFMKAWRSQPLNIIPVKKMAKAFMHFYKY